MRHGRFFITKYRYKYYSLLKIKLVFLYILAVMTHTHQFWAQDKLLQIDFNSISTCDSLGIFNGFYTHLDRVQKKIINSVVAN